MAPPSSDEKRLVSLRRRRAAGEMPATDGDEVRDRNGIGQGQQQQQQQPIYPLTPRPRSHYESQSHHSTLLLRPTRGNNSNRKMKKIQQQVVELQELEGVDVENVQLMGGFYTNESNDLLDEKSLLVEEGLAAEAIIVTDNAEEEQESEEGQRVRGSGSQYLDEYSCARKIYSYVAGKMNSDIIDNNNNLNNDKIIKAHTMEIEYDYEFVAEATEADEVVKEVRGEEEEETATAATTTDFSGEDDQEELPPSTLPAMEWGTLWTVAHSMGLHGCHLNVQSIPPSSSSSSLPPSSSSQHNHNDFLRRNNRNRNLQAPQVEWQQQREDEDGIDEDPSLVVSLSSSPIDQYDPTVSSCEFLATSNPNEKCYPMRGIMTVTYAGNDPVAVQNYVLERIEQELDGQGALTGGVSRTKFLGNRAQYVPTSPAGTTSAKGGPGSSPTSLTPISASYVAITASVAVVAVLTLLIAALVLVRKKRRMQQKDRQTAGESSSTSPKKDNDSKGEPDVERSDTNCSSPHSEGGNNDHSPIKKAASDGVVMVDGGSPSKSFGESTIVTVKSIGSSTTLLMSNKKRQQKTSPPVDVDSLMENTTDSLSTGTSDTADSECAGTGTPDGSSEMATTATPRVVDVLLPPLPPTGPSKTPPAAQSLKKRRKKKKKSKRKLTRVNSRDNVKEMETIDEALEEEGSDSDDGSEYSWCSTDDSEASRSRDPSPVRSSTPEADIIDPSSMPRGTFV